MADKDTLFVLMQAETPNPFELHSVCSHHIDWLIDFDGNRDIISSVHDVYTADKNNDSAKTELSWLVMLREILSAYIKTGKTEAVKFMATNTIKLINEAAGKIDITETADKGENDG